MQEATASFQKSISLNAPDNETNKTFLNLRNILLQLGFNFAEHPNRPDNYFYASVGSGRPHVLFIAELPQNETSSGHPTNINATRTALNCFVSACSQLIAENGCNGKISIFIQKHRTTDRTSELKAIFKQIGILPQNVDFCIIGEPNRSKKIGQEINIGNLGNLLLTITSFGNKSSVTSAVSPQNNAVQNLLNLLYKLKSNLLDGGNETFSSSTINIMELKSSSSQPLHFPAKASATILIRYNNNHTPQDIIRWMQNHINFTSGQFELNAKLISTPYISDISAGMNTLKQSIPYNITGNPRYNTNCTSIFSNVIKDYCPFAEFGFATGNQDNEDNVSYLRLIYYRFLHRYLSGHN